MAKGLARMRKGWMESDGIWVKTFDAKLLWQVPRRMLRLIKFRFQYITGCNDLLVPGASWTYIGPYRWYLDDKYN